MQQKNTQGGYRPGAGRKSKFNEPSSTISVRVPESKSDYIKKIIDRWIKKRF